MILRPRPFFPSLLFLGFICALPGTAASQKKQKVPPPPPPSAADTSTDTNAETQDGLAPVEEPALKTASQDDEQVAEVLEGLTRSEDEVFEHAAEISAHGAETEGARAPVLQGSFTKRVRFAAADDTFVFEPFAWVQPVLKLHITGDSEGESLEGSGFELQRARIGFRLGLFEKASLCILLGARTGQVRPEGFFVDIHPFGEAIALKVGFFRPYFGRQFLMATTQLQMIDYARAWTDPRMDLGIDLDLGAGLHGLLFGGLEYAIGIWNGEGRNFSLGSPPETINGEKIPGNIDMLVGGRVAVHPLALAGLSDALLIGNESDVARSRVPQVSVGLALMYNRRHDNSITLPLNGLDYRYEDSRIKFGAEVGFKMLGISLLAEAFILRPSIHADDPDIESVVKILGRDATGFATYFQGGYFIVPEKLEVAARFDFVDENTDSEGKRLFPAFGLNYYFLGNNLKLQAMYRYNRYTKYDAGDPLADNPNSHDLMLMVQAAI